MKKYFINQKAQVICLTLFYFVMFMEYVYSAPHVVRECVFNIAIDNDLSCENFATIERHMLDYQDIENFKEGCTAAADDEAEVFRISAFAKAMHEYLYKKETSCCMTGSRDGKTLKRLYLKELNKHSKNIF